MSSAGVAARQGAQSCTRIRDALGNLDSNLVAVLVRSCQKRLSLGRNQISHTLLRPLEQTILPGLILSSLFFTVQELRVIFHPDLIQRVE